MEILHLYDEHYQVIPGKGSVSTFIYNVAKCSAESGHDVRVLERRWDGLETSEVRDGITFERFDLAVGSSKQGEEIPYNEVRSPLGLPKLLLDRLEFALRLRSYLRDESFDVLHVHLPFTANILIHLLPELRDKMVYTAHIGEEQMRFDFGDSSDGPFFLEYWGPDEHLMNRVGASVVLNPELAAKIESHDIADVEVIPNGVNVTKFDASPEVRNDEPITILFVGSVTPRKGVDLLLDAASEVIASTEQPVTFRIVGDTELEAEFVEECRETIQAGQLQETVVLEGYVDKERLQQLYRDADIFVMPSREEGFGMALTEALATSTPAVGSQVGGIPLQIDDGYNGRLFEKGDSSELAAHVTELVEDEQKRIEMGENARKKVETEFTWQSVAEQYLALYRNSIL